MHIDTRWATTKPDDIRRHAAELAALGPDVILAGTGTTTVAPLLQATRTVPIVFTVVIDPVGAGFVASLRGRAATRPGPLNNAGCISRYQSPGECRLSVLKRTCPFAPHVSPFGP